MKSNQTQINIPSDWQLVKLGDICDFKKGKGLPKDDITADGKYDAIHYGELFTKYHEKIENILSKTNNNKNVFLSKKNDILMPTSDVTPRGLSTASFINKDGIILGGDILVIRPKSNILHGLFFSNFVSSQKKEVMKLVSGTTVFHLYGSDMAKLRFFLPPINEQNRIVSVLENWDKAIEKLSKKIEIKKQIKKGLMQDLLTGKKRLKEFSKKWETVELGDVIDFINGYTFKSSSYCENGNYKIITIANVQDGFMFIEGSKTIKDLPLNVTDDQILKKGDILVSMTGNVGRVCIVNNDNCLLNQRVGKIKAKGINQELLYLMLHDRRFLNKMIDSAQGGAQANLSTGDIKEYIVDIPQSKEEQAAIAKILTTADREINTLKQKLKVLKDQKRYLLNNLITGVIRTPETLSTKLTQ